MVEEPLEAQTSTRAEGGEEEIIEKKPSAPEAIVLMILTTIFLGFAAYIAGDEMSGLFRTNDYKAEPERKASYYYEKFKRENPERAPEGAVPAETGR